MTDMPEVAQAVDRQCQGGHSHQEVIDSAGGMKRSAWSQVYPDQLAKALVRGARSALLEEMKSETFGVNDQGDGSLEPEEAEASETKRPTRDDMYHGRPQSIDASLRRLHVNLGHAPVPTMMRHLRHANATEAALKMASDFYCPECDIKADPKPARPAAPDIAQPPLKSIGMDVKELPGWQPNQTIKALNIVCDTSSLQSMTPFNEDDEEVAVDLLRMYRDNWTRPYLRPKWLRVDPAKPHVSQIFTSAMERDGTTVLDTAGGAKEQNGKVERHGQWFAQMLRAVISEVQPQDRASGGSAWPRCRRPRTPS